MPGFFWGSAGEARARKSACFAEARFERLHFGGQRMYVRRHLVWLVERAHDFVLPFPTDMLVVQQRRQHALMSQVLRPRLQLLRRLAEAFS